MNSFLALVCLATLAFASATVDYCTLNCEDTETTNVACDISDGLGSSCPEGTEAYDITGISSIQKIILKSHNDKRNLVASGDEGKYPIATRMLTMLWDRELAYTADCQNRGCSEINPCHRTTRFNKPGQNIAVLPMGPNSKLDELIEEAIAGWFSTSQFFTDLMADIQSFPESSPYDHEHPASPFARMVIGRNVLIGCAGAEIPRDEGSDFWLTCNYGYDTEVGKELYYTGPVAGLACTKKNLFFKNLCYKADTDRYLKKVLA